MMLIDDISTLKEIIPTIVGDRFEMYEPMIADATTWLIGSVLGCELYADILALESNKEPYILAQRVVAYKSYAMAIPLLDLVETGNGFAVVNDATLAPASTVRVNALKTQIELNLCSALDALQAYLEGWSECHEAWQKSEGCTLLVDTLLPTLTLFKRYSQFVGSRFDYVAQRSTLLTIQMQHIAPVVSTEFLSHLIADPDLSDLESDVKELLRFALGAYYIKEANVANSILLKAREFMMKSISEFPLFEASDSYKLFSEVSSAPADCGGILMMM